MAAARQSPLLTQQVRDISICSDLRITVLDVSVVPRTVIRFSNVNRSSDGLETSRYGRSFSIKIRIWSCTSSPCVETTTSRIQEFSAQPLCIPLAKKTGLRHWGCRLCHQSDATQVETVFPLPVGNRGILQTIFLEHCASSKSKDANFTA